MSHHHTPAARTHAVRLVLAQVLDPNEAADLLFLEEWEARPVAGAAASLRIRQLHLAQPALTVAVRAEIANWPEGAAART